MQVDQMSGTPGAVSCFGQPTHASQSSNTRILAGILHPWSCLTSSKKGYSKLQTICILVVVIRFHLWEVRETPYFLSSRAFICEVRVTVSSSKVHVTVIRSVEASLSSDKTLNIQGQYEHWQDIIYLVVSY